MPKIPTKLPVVLSQEEVLQFLESVPHIKPRTILTTCYATGLRITEAVHLKSCDIDSQRMVIRSLATTANYLRIAITKVCSATSPLDLLPHPVEAKAFRPPESI